MKINVKDRNMVVPGELLAEGELLLGEGTFRRNGKIYSNVLGLADVKDNFIKIIPLRGQYMPSPRDLVIGIVDDISFSSWSIDINSAYSGIMNIANATERYVEKGEDLSKIYGIGDVVVAKILDVSGAMVVGMTMKDRGLFKLKDGILIDVNPAKVPRIIGKKGTMVQMLKTMTDCKIIVGQNGKIWVNGDKQDVAIETIRFIEDNAHLQGLTEKVKVFLEKKTGVKSGVSEEIPKKTSAAPPDSPKEEKKAELKPIKVKEDD